jgi:hypothetical protein
LIELASINPNPITIIETPPVMTDNPKNAPTPRAPIKDYIVK